MTPAGYGAQDSRWDTWRISAFSEITGFYENATYVRDSAGLSKFRNTVQINAEREFGELGIFSNVSWNGVFRGSYDGVYDLNSNE